MKDWHTVSLSPDASLEQAIKVLDAGGLRIAVVVDSDSKLLGTITDGDIRRALLKHLSVEAKVTEFMCATPLIGSPDWSRDKLLSELERFKLLHIPVVDENGKILGIHVLHELLDARRLDNPVFLMAGGFGKRLYPLTEHCPKPMLKVGDKPMLELILESFIEFGFHNFYVSTHYLPHVIHDYFGDGKKWGVSIKYIHEEVPLGTGGALGLLPHDEINLPVILMNGDLLTKVDFRSLLDFHQLHNGTATLCVREYENQVPYGVVQSQGHQVTRIVEKPVSKFFISAGIYVLSPALIKSVVQGSVVDMPSLLQSEIDIGRKVNIFPVHEYWLDIGRVDDYNKAQVEIERMGK